ncbi:nucleotide-binding protein [Alisedimentitalea sp. MJ-SS2]|nr:nucleotide-binding protein [Alisedimentitalea sp. MJ-SS2]
MAQSEPSGADSEETKRERREPTDNKKVFIVHGHDDALKQSVARTIEKLGLEPVILSEKPNSGRTVIEKFEHNADVGFAIVLMTADDCARNKKADNGQEELRARQNVVLELGYFFGSLGRDRVFVLKEKDVSEPSDILGIVYEPVDPSGNWKLSLAKELKNANYVIDANSLLS